MKPDLIYFCMHKSDFEDLCNYLELLRHFVHLSTGDGEFVLATLKAFAKKENFNELLHERILIMKKMIEEDFNAETESK